MLDRLLERIDADVLADQFEAAQAVTQTDSLDVTDLLSLFTVTFKQRLYLDACDKAASPHFGPVFDWLEIAYISVEVSKVRLAFFD